MAPPPRGNRTLDERGGRTKPENAADAYLKYNARDQLVSWRRPGNRGREDRRGWETRYTLDPSGAMTRKRELDEDGVLKLDTQITLAGGRVDTIHVDDQEQVPGTTVKLRQSYRYDDGGNLQRVYHDASSTNAGQPVTLPEPTRASKTPPQCRADDAGNLPAGRQRVTRYCFDEFNRQVFASGYGENDPTEVYYDGLDRRDRTKVLKPGGAERDLTYLGTTELLARESPRGTPAGEERFAYDYTSAGDRIGQQSSRGGNRFYAFDRDANGSVIGLEQDGDGSEPAGAIRSSDRYDYDPYGALDVDENESGNDDQSRFGLSAQAGDNPFRFQGFYADSRTDSCDMHARGYRPGGAQFLSRDMYASAAGDFALTADLLTLNRYAFAGGNPVSNVEFDGHHYGTSGGSSPSGNCKTRHCTPDGDQGRSNNLPASGPLVDSTGETRGSATISPPSAAEQAILGNGPKSPGWGGVTVHPARVISPVVSAAQDVGNAFKGVRSLEDAVSRGFGFACGFGGGLACPFLQTADPEQFEKGERGGAGAGLLAAPLAGIYGAGRAVAKRAASGARAGRPRAGAEASRSAGRASPYAGVRAASAHLQAAGVPREFRKEILGSFESGTIRVRRAGEEDFGLRCFGSSGRGNGANAKGRYLFPTFPAGRSSLALPDENAATSLAQFRIRPGATYFEGRVAGQFGHSGGGTQYFVPDLNDLERVR